MKGQVQSKNKCTSDDEPLSAGRARLSSIPIAIVGLAFRFPGDLCDESDFWAALKEGKDLVGEIPFERWATDELRHAARSEPGRSVTFSAGVLSRIDEFDAEFFGISPREAALLDPQQRVLLELAWEAMENSGIPPSSMAGSDCAVYVGISGLDYGMRWLDDLASMSAHSMTGNTLSIAANRLSYFFDLRGPSLAVDTACSSSLVALHHACASLRAGEASTALVGGINLLLHPYPFVGFTKASMLSAAGRCKAFDASGDGYVRAEGGAVFLLKRLDRAVADGDDIRAVILSSGVNADGARKTGITIPSSAGQAELMREVLAKSGLSAHEIDFIEAHGTGTAVGDPAEAAAIGEIYGRGRTCALPISSVKANVGHLEPASGMAGMVKALLALKNRALPPALHLKTANPHIDFHGLNLELVSEYTPLANDSGRALVAGVNSFGFGGANAHVLLKEFLPLPAVSPRPDVPTPPLFLSARTGAALRAMAGQYAHQLASKVSDFYDVAHAAAYGRERMEKRLSINGSAPAETLDLLSRFARGGESSRIIIEDRLPASGGVAFVYSGNGAQWIGMGRSLMKESPSFAHYLEKLDAAMRPVAGFSILTEMLAEPAAARLDDTVVAQPLLFAIQIAATTLLRDRGVVPVAVAGHSVGEVAAAWAAGALDLPQAIRVICARSQAQALTRGNGRMAAVGLSADAMKELLAELNGSSTVEIAGINSPNNVTVSGLLCDLERLRQTVETRGVFFRLLDLDYAFHSWQMDGIERQLADALIGLVPANTGEAVFVSTVTGEVLDGSALDAEYWWRNVRQPVRFSEAVATLAVKGCRVFIEIGPHAILQRYIRESLTAVDVKGRVIPTLSRERDGIGCIDEAALRAQLLQDAPNLESYFPVPGGRVKLPNYPWQRERHWHPQSSEALLSIQRRRVHPLLGWRLQDAEVAWENTLDPSLVPWLADHRVGSAVVFPAAAYAEMALCAAREWLGGEHLIIEEVDIVSPMVFDEAHARTLRLVLGARDGSFQIKSRQRLSTDEWILHATGRVLESANRMPASSIPALPLSARSVDNETHYRLTSAIGLDYGPSFQGLKCARILGNRLEAALELPDGLATDAYLLHPALLDVCFQSLVNFFGETIQAEQGVAFLPVKIGRLDLVREGSVVCVRGCLARRGNRSVLMDFELLDANGHLVAKAVGCRFRAAHLRRSGSKEVCAWQTIRRLRPHPVDETTTKMPALRELTERLHAGFAKIENERQIWYKETLPLLEALTLSFTYEAFRELERRSTDFQQRISASPFGRWLTRILQQENLLGEQGGQWALDETSDLPPADEIWRELCRSSNCLAQLVLLGRIGRYLPELLASENDSLRFLDELRHSPVAETLYNDDPAYLGTRLAAQETLQCLAAEWPASRRLRVLEIAPGLSDLPKTLIAALPEDRFDYVLALTDEALATRQRGEYEAQSKVSVTTLDPATWQLPADCAGPETFDVIIVRHVVHRSASIRVALAQIRRWLAPGGLLLLAERHPDLSANFIAGLDPCWWHPGAGANASEGPSLLPPEAWRQALLDEGFEGCEHLAEGVADGLAEGAYLVLAKRPATDAVILATPGDAVWSFLADDASLSLANQLRSHLESLGQHVVIERDGQNIVGSVDHVVHLFAWDKTPEAGATSLTNLLQTTQALSRLEKAPRLWVVTCNGALVFGQDSRPSQAAVWGFGRVIMNEHPALSCTLIDIAGDHSAADIARRLENELLRPDGANEIVLAAEGRYCLSMQAFAPHRPSGMDASRFHLDFHAAGQLRNLVWLAADEKSLRDDEVEVSVHATGLNFRDVMYLMGLLPDEAVESGFAGASLGLEFSGTVKRIGTAVRHLQPGDAVMGFGASCFASHVTTRADAVARIPEAWSFEAAATVPTVFFTVYYALKHLASLQPGERVLVHGGAGGVGIAAIQMAKHLGAEIFVTAGSDEKRDFVRLLGADHVFDSRSLSFADDILAVTNGEGVDVVLNSLAGEAIRRNLGVLKPFGRFLELGKRDFFENTPVGLRPFKNNISYFGIDADQLLIGRPQLAARLFREVVALFREGVLSPLPFRAFSADRVVDAFRAMQQSRHIGKVIVSLQGAVPTIEEAVPPQSRVSFDRETTWLVTGGLSGFGLASARWLAEHGVGNLVLIGRRGMSTPGADEAIEELTSQGVKVLALACDVADSEAVRGVIERIRETLPPLKGVLHAAATFDDRLLASLDVESLDAVLRPKLQGAWCLHQATLDLPLEYFVLYSSVSTAIGNLGQANYVAANAGLEGLAAMRRYKNLPATCIGWGPIADAGYLARNEAVKDGLSQRLGSAPMSAADALSQLERILLEGSCLQTIANFDWSVLSRLLPSAGTTRFDELNRNLKDLGHADESFDIRAFIAEKTPEEVAEFVRQLVAQEVAQILCIDCTRIPGTRSLHDLGMDSLMAVELATALEVRFKIQLPVMMLGDAPTVDQVAQRIVDKLTNREGMAETAASAAAGLARQHGEEVSPEQMAILTEVAREVAAGGARLAA